MRFLILLLFIVFNINFSISQDIKIKLNQKIGYGPFSPSLSGVIFCPPQSHPIYNLFSKLEFNNIPSDLTEVKKGIIAFDFLQFLFQNYRGTENFNLYMDFKKERSYEILDEQLSTNKIMCFVKLVFGKNSENVPICIIDTNQNGNFSDENIILLENIVSIDDLKSKDIKINETVYQISNGKNTIDSKLPIKIFLYDNELFYSIPTYMEGNLPTKEEIYVSHEFRFPDYYVSTININNNNLNIRKDDIFQWNNKNYRNKGYDIRSNTLLLKDENNNKQDFILNDLVQLDIKTNTKINLDTYKGKYIFIDFWGSWCPPCLQQLPTLSSFYNAIDKSKIDFIGVAGRDKHENALKVINEKSIAWKNILSDDQNKLIKILNVVKYPTGILINPEGKIIEKDINIVELGIYLRKNNLLK